MNNFAELNSFELQDIDGGIGGFAVAAVIGVAVGCFGAGYMVGKDIAEKKNR